jgi:hypothetical protein
LKIFPKLYGNMSQKFQNQARNSTDHVGGIQKLERKKNMT